MSDTSNPRSIDLDLIRIDGGTQSRAALNEAVVGDYAELLESGFAMPPVVLYFDGSAYWLADGFHRVHAHRHAGCIAVLADVRQGTRREAILHSVGANAHHGLRRTNADKRQAVETLLRDEEWAAWSDREIAAACGVSVPFVGAQRRPEVAAQQKANRAASAGRGVIGLHHPAPPAPAEGVVGLHPAAPAPAAAPAEGALAASPSPLPHEDEAHADPVAELEERIHAYETATAGEHAAAAEIERLGRQLRTVEAVRDELMVERNELTREVKRLKRDNQVLREQIERLSA